jgi:hypothetical protein
VTTNFHQLTRIFLVLFVIIVSGKSAMMFFAPRHYKILIRCCVATLLSLYAILTVFYCVMTPELALFVLNSDIFYFLFCIMLLSTLLDVRILDLSSFENAEMFKMNMWTAMGMNGLVYCFLLSAVTYGY